MKTLITILLYAGLVGCATTPAQDPTLPAGMPATPTPAVTPVQGVNDALSALANNPLLSAVNQDATDTLAWVNSAKGPQDALAKFRASQCPTAIQLATKNLQDDIKQLQGMLKEMESQLPVGSPSVEMILYFTKLRYGPATMANPKTMIEQMKHDIAERVTAVADSCRAVVPIKQIDEMLHVAAKAGLLTTTAGAAAPIIGMVP